MKKIILALIMSMTVILLSSCTETAVSCGEGTTLVENACVLLEDLKKDEDKTPDDKAEVKDICSADTGLHTVPGASMTTISEWLNWTFIGGQYVSDPDNAWIQNYGAAVFNVNNVAPQAWQGSFTQSGMFLKEGCEYTFSFKLRTDVTSVKPNVIVFGENTSGVSFFEELVDLDTFSNVYNFTVVPETSDYVSTGVYFANTRGMVVIEEIQITRSPIGTYSEAE